jgi:NAD(P)-dependent dehydrogenase (short-subunit alcohol dehydrogenase family)
MAGTRGGTATRVPVRLTLQVLATAGSIGAQIGREAAREGATWVLETRRRHRVMNGELPGLVALLDENPAHH